MATLRRRQRLVRGKDWHAWVFRYDDPAIGLCWVAGERDNRMRGVEGQWVRVKFVELKGRKP